MEITYDQSYVNAMRDDYREARTEIDQLKAEVVRLKAEVADSRNFPLDLLKTPVLELEQLIRRLDEEKAKIRAAIARLRECG